MHVRFPMKLASDVESIGGFLVPTLCNSLPVTANYRVAGRKSTRVRPDEKPESLYIPARLQPVLQYLARSTDSTEPIDNRRADFGRVVFL
jgi:hypothetical protein